MLVNAIAILAVEFALAWLVVPRARWIGAGAFVAFNLLLLIDLAPLLFPGVVYSLTGPNNVLAAEDRLKATFGAASSTQHLILQQPTIGGELADPNVFATSFLEPPCAKACLELIQALDLTGLQVSFSGDCDNSGCGKPGSPEARELFLIVRRPPRGCSDEAPRCRDTAIGRLSYEFALNPARDFELKSVRYAEKRRWLTELTVMYELTYVMPDHFPIRLTVEIHPAPLLLFPTIGGGNPFWPSATAIDLNYVRHLLD
jgi:hypothetical protein